MPSAIINGCWILPCSDSLTDMTSLSRMLVIVASLLGLVGAHPLCLDFSPPFTPTGGLDFCSEYSTLACCTRDQDDRIAARYYRSVGGARNATCAAHLKTLLCIECSPLAVHLYDAETTLVKKPFPGLCRGYCGDVYRSCPEIVPLITNSTQLLAALRSGESDFCNAVRITDVNYCYPDVLTSQEFGPNQTHAYSNTEGCVCLRKFAGSLRNPLLLLSADDGSGRIFVGEQLGLVNIFYRNGTRRQEFFLDISNVVLDSASPGDERGFLGMAFHPDFRANQRFYVYYSIGRDGSFRNRISEFTTSATNRDTINRTSERVLLEMDKPFSNHNGGQMLFGVDGYLYITTGDGGSGGDPFNNAQNLSTLLGKVLRIDVDARSPGLAYGIPPSNPFLSTPKARPEVFAYGCRNMWRCSVDRGDPQTGYGRGRIFCGDVGQSKWEEVDVIKSGRNYGWNTREGAECYNSMCGRIGPEEYPIFAYNHSVGNCIIGGYVYRGCNSPNFQGLYFFADYGYGKLFRLKESVSNAWESKEIFTCGKDVCYNDLTWDFERNILSFGEDDTGEIYILTTSYPSTQSFSGSIYQLVDPRRRGDPTSCSRSPNTIVTPTQVSSTTATTTTASTSTSTTTPSTTTTRTSTTTTTPSTTTASTSTTTPSTTTASTSTTTPSTTTASTSTTTPSTTTAKTSTSAQSTTTSRTTPGPSSSTVGRQQTSWNWSCDFEKIDGSPDFCNTVQANDDQFDWTIFKDPTPSDPTGPDFAYSAPWYIYIEASTPRQPNDTAKIYLPSPPSPGEFCLSFHYHMFGFHIRELQVFVETSNPRSTVTVWRSTGQKGNYWLFARISVSIAANQRMGFIGVRGDEYSGDIGLDAIRLTSGACSA